MNGTDKEISISDFKYHIKKNYKNDQKVEKFMEYFWEILTDYDDTKRRALLKFVTNLEKVPIGGFVKLNPKFKIDLKLSHKQLP